MKMRKTVMCMMLGAATLAASCVSENHSDLAPGGEDKATGMLMIDLKSNLPFSPATRALNEDDYRNTDEYTVQLVQSANGALVFECKASELGDYLPKRVPIGGYEVKAWYGEEHDASRNEFRVEGEDQFTVKSGENTATIVVECTPTCGKLVVAFDDTMADYYEDYSVTFGGTAALGARTINWEKDDTEPWYIALNKEGEDVTYTISLTTKPEYAHTDAAGNKTTEAKIEGKKFNLQRNHSQKLTLKPSYTPGTEGGLSITITIDDSTEDHEIEWEVPMDWVY